MEAYFRVVYFCYLPLIIGQEHSDITEEKEPLTEPIRRLKNEGIVKEHPTGGYVIETTPDSIPFTLPKELKKQPIEYLPKIWINISHFPWFGDKDCGRYRIVFNTQKALPLIGLASFPRSGNTWARHLIEKTTGFFTGSFYYAKYLLKNGLFGEAVPFDSGLVTLIKGHGNYNPEDVQRINYLEPTTKKEDFINQMRITDNNAILLIRNPYHVIYSYRNYVKKGDSGHAKDSYFFGADWDSFVRITIQLWEQFYTDWLEEGKNIMIIYYEKLKTDQLNSTLLDIALFVNQTIENKRLECLTKHSKANFSSRSKCLPRPEKGQKSIESEYIYSEKQLAQINSSIKRVMKKALYKKGFDYLHFMSYIDNNLKINYCPFCNGN